MAEDKDQIDPAPRPANMVEPNQRVRGVPEDGMTELRSPPLPPGQSNPAHWSGTTNFVDSAVARNSEMIHRRNAALLDSGGSQVFPPAEQKTTIETVTPANSAATVDVPPGPVAGTAPEALSGAATLGPESSLTAGADVISAQRGARGAALVANREAIVINVEALVLLLDDKIAALDGANSDEGRAELEQYRYVKKELEKFRGTTAAFAVGKVSEDVAIDASLSFFQGIRNWWTKYHVEICNTAFSASIFLSCLGICKLAGADADLATLVSGVIAKGKSVTDALRAASDAISGLNPKN